MTATLPDFDHDYWRKPRDDWERLGLHFHGYAWTGSGASYGRDAERRDPSSDLPPVVVRGWLGKPRQRERPVFAAPGDAVDWLRGEFGQHAGQMVRSRDGHVDGIPDETRWGMARHNLECGLDVMWGFWLGGGTSFLSLAVVGVADCGVRH